MSLPDLLRHFISLPHEIVTIPVVLGGYSFFLGEIYRSRHIYYEVGKMALVAAGFSYLTGFTNIAFIFSALMNNGNITKHIFQRTLIVYVVCMSASFYSLVTLGWGTTVLYWELPRFVGGLLHLRMLFDMLKKLREKQQFAEDLSFLKSDLPQLTSAPAPLPEGAEVPSRCRSPARAASRSCSPVPVHRSYTHTHTASSDPSPCDAHSRPD